MIKPLTGKAKRSVQLATARYNIWEGAVRSSKTVASTFRWMQYVRNGPGGNLAMLGKTERTLKRNVIDPMIDMLGSKRCRYMSGSGELYLFGRRIYTAGANDARAIEKIQGLTLAGAYGDEIATWPEDLWNMLGTRLSVPGAQFFGTCNPAGPVHWLKVLLDQAAMWLDHDGAITRSQDGDPLDMHRFSFTLDDNPHLSPDFIRSLKRQYVGLFFKRYIQGLWVPAEGAIYDMFDTDRHVVTAIPAISRWIGVGIDHGTRNPFHAVLLGLGADRKLHITSDWRWDSARQRRQLSDAEYSREVRHWLGGVPVPRSDRIGVQPERAVVDPSATGFRVQLQQDGLASMLADNSVLPGIRTISTLYSLDLLDIHESCQELIRETLGYSWDDKAAAKGEDVPMKVADHGPDAKRYIGHTTRAAWRGELRERLHLPA
ncbi:putative phage terminase [Actinoplanes missouriensis 431]|uniref:Putative phage terminase n=1 Tax=Actinoplanes missouriensis (strain ATCC 14538 / DSM 43046 / CBS 188.64 / JCM 3121 / NBRC 102363 / NCIMB 12654 / NRRL B-3342 / UNCC 431) TaxID=512565 RepID=I0GXI8_ACTM4|nr:terminase family protein [Actinoplanes missouriensis]KOX45268.1 terminase [Streptomyces purpurogeneiscleroticus]BAL85475.1 putative phage terminase [Actinoplanes missouriensis 431]